MPGLFVTATGTDSGKTFVAAGLLRAARRAGRAVSAMKPVASGFDPNSAERSDTALLSLACGGGTDAGTLAAISPWRFAAPLSPDMAAAAEGRTIDGAAVVAACRAFIKDDALTIVEGIGGVMVPLNDTETVLDLMAALDLPILLVTGSELGALSYALTAMAALGERGLVPAAIVVNGLRASDVPLDATMATIARFARKRWNGSGLVVRALSRDAAEAEFDALFAEVIGAPFPPA